MHPLPAAHITLVGSVKTISSAVNKANTFAAVSFRGYGLSAMISEVRKTEAANSEDFYMIGVEQYCYRGFSRTLLDKGACKNESAPS